jgi:hypothetical protein
MQAKGKEQRVEGKEEQGRKPWSRCPGRPRQRLGSAGLCGGRSPVLFAEHPLGGRRV